MMKINEEARCELLNWLTTKVGSSSEQGGFMQKNVFTRENLLENVFYDVYIRLISLDLINRTLEEVKKALIKSYRIRIRHLQQQSKTAYEQILKKIDELIEKRVFDDFVNIVNESKEKGRIRAITFTSESSGDLELTFVLKDSQKTIGKIKEATKDEN